MSTIETSDSLKSLREALCLAQSALSLWRLDGDRPVDRSATLGRLIADIDRQRPLGPDGKHGDRHTETCGCAVQVCTACAGCGQVANSEDREPWTFWLDLPLKSAAAVALGLVRPVPCDGCGGSGQVTR